MGVSISGIVFEAILFALSVYLIWGLSTSTLRRSLLVGAFGLRSMYVQPYYLASNIP